jgi:hypothetical protein
MSLNADPLPALSPASLDAVPRVTPGVRAIAGLPAPLMEETMIRSGCRMLPSCAGQAETPGAPKRSCPGYARPGDIGSSAPWPGWSTYARTPMRLQ